MEKNKKSLLISLLIILVAFLIGPTYTSSPFLGNINLIDEGQFGAWVNHMSHGKYLFKDIYLTYGPLYVYPLYLVFKIFTPSAFIIRSYLALGSTLGIVVCYLILQRLNLSKVITFIIITLLIILPIMHFRQAMGLIVIYCLIRAVEKASKLWFFFGGSFIAFSFLVSQDIGIFTFLVFIFLILYKLIFNKNLRILIFNLIFSVLGFSLVFVPFILWAGYEKWLSEYFQVTLNVITSFSGINVPNGQNFPSPLCFGCKSFILEIKYIFSKDALLYWEILFYISALMYFIVRLVLKLNNKMDGKLFIVWLFGFFLYMILLSRSGIGHFYYTLSPMLILLGYFADRLYNKLTGAKNLTEKATSMLLLSASAFFLLRLVLINRPQIKEIIKIPRAALAVKNNPDRVGSVLISSSQKKYIKDIQDYILKNTTKKDYVFFLNDEPMMYFFLDRVNPTRYDLPFLANTLEKRLELLSDLNNKKPKYIIEDRKVWAVDGINNRTRLPEVLKYIGQKYKQCDLIDNQVVVYCLIYNNQ